PIGLGIAYALDRRRQAKTGNAEPAGAAQDNDATPSWVRSLAVAGGVVGALAGIGYGEHAASSRVGKLLASALPGGPQLWKLAGHGLSLGLLGAAAGSFYGRAMHKV